MTDPLRIVGWVIWGLVIGAWVIYLASARASGRRRNAGVCTRCGETPVGQSSEAAGDVFMCHECLRTTQRNYRAGAWFCFGLSGLFGLLAPVVFTSEVRRFGIDSALRAAGILLPMILLTAGAGVAIRLFSRKLR
jgi:hypothetical protein